MTAVRIPTVAPPCGPSNVSSFAPECCLSPTDCSDTRHFDFCHTSGDGLIASWPPARRHELKISCERSFWVKTQCVASGYFCAMALGSVFTSSFAAARVWAPILAWELTQIAPTHVFCVGTRSYQLANWLVSQRLISRIRPILLTHYSARASNATIISAIVDTVGKILGRDRLYSTGDNYSTGGSNP
jgi:hypothetical protein